MDDVASLAVILASLAATVATIGVITHVLSNKRRHINLITGVCIGEATEDEPRQKRRFKRHREF